MQKSGNLRLIAIIVLIGVFVFSVTNPGSHQLSSVGYSSAFQGPSISFYGESWNNRLFTQTPTTSLSFNPNILNPNAGFPLYTPTILGEMTTVFLPADSANHINFPSIAGISIPNSWTQNVDLLSNIAGYTGQNPDATYAWNITNSAGTPLMVDMKQYEMKFYVAFNCQWNKAEDPADYLQTFPSSPVPLITSVDNTYQNLNVWFKIDTTPSWYIQGLSHDNEAFFAIAKMQLADNVQKEGITSSGSKVTPRSDEQLNPYSAQAVQYLYYNPWGGNQASNPTSETYDGQVLNSAYFRNTTYFSVDLANFGVYAHDTGTLDTGTVTLSDVATFSFDITVFVFGQYTVQDIQSDPSQFGLFTPESYTVGILSGAFNWLTNPVNIGILTTIGLLILVIIFAPWLLVVLIALVFGGRRR